MNITDRYLPGDEPRPIRRPVKLTWWESGWMARVVLIVWSAFMVGASIYYLFDHEDQGPIAVGATLTGACALVALAWWWAMTARTIPR